jgi:hypothetical protein
VIRPEPAKTTSNWLEDTSLSDSAITRSMNEAKSAVQLFVPVNLPGSSP